MIIDRIELYHVAMPLIYPWRTSYGEDAAVHSVLVRMISGPHDAWAESGSLAAPCYSPEWAGGVFATVKHWLAPTILGHDVRSGADLQRRLSIFKGNPFAKAALDNAWWSLQARITEQPLHTLLGATRNEVDVGADFGVMDHIDQLIDNIREAVELGFARIKLKFSPAWEIPILRAVRDQFPDQPMHIDCNGAYRIDNIDVLRQVDEFGLTMIEQPLQHDDLVDHASLQQQIQTPICLDESIVHLRAAQQAIALRSCRYVNIKPGRVGGLTVAVAIHDACQQAGIPCWVGSMLESATGAAQLIALSMLDNFTYPADIFPSSRFYEQDLSDTSIRLHTSAAGRPAVRPLDDLPEPNRDRLQAQTVESVTLGTGG